MQRLLVACLAWVLLGCGCGAATPTPADGGEDATPDAGGVADVGPSVDAAYERPAWLPPLSGACGAWTADPADPATYDTRPELAHALAQMHCRHAVRCNDLVEALACDPVRVTDGALRGEVDLARAAQCIAAWDSAPCEDSGAGTPERYRVCQPLEQGVTAPGGLCTEQSDCAGLCRNESFATCEGACLSDAEARCDAGCPPGQLCSVGRCVMPVPHGEPCVPGRPCALGSRCRGDVCEPYPGLGERCAQDLGFPPGFCDAGLLCDVDGRCRTQHTVAVGQACGGASICADGSYCDGVCFALGTSVGDDCIAAADPRHALRCVPPLYCAASPGGPGTCQPRRASGEECDASDACADPDQRCHPVDDAASARSVCAEIVGPGCPCGPAALCPSQYECHEGACAHVATIVHPCRLDGGGSDECFMRGGTCDDGVCVPHLLGDRCSPAPFHLCLEGTCVNGWCVAPGETGDPCRADAGCNHPETCVRGRCTPPPGVSDCPPVTPP